MNRTMMQLTILDIDELKPHEKVVQSNLKEVLNSLEKEGVLKEPIVADFNTKVILDGHHRYNAFKELGEEKIPCVLVDYFSENIKVEHRKEGEISKQEVVEKGLSNELFPPKTSKHTLKGKISSEIDYSLNSD